MSQTKIFNFFPGSIHTTSIIRILSSFPSRYEDDYISHCNFYINRLYFEISNSRQKQCLKIGTRRVNHLEPAKLRVQADSGTEKICYYKRNEKDKSFNSFLVVRKETAFPSEIKFSIVKVTDNADRHDNIYSEISEKLFDFKNDDVQQIVQRASESNSVRETATSRSNGRRQKHTGHGPVRKNPRFLL